MAALLAVAASVRVNALLSAVTRTVTELVANEALDLGTAGGLLGLLGAGLLGVANL